MIEKSKFCMRRVKLLLGTTTPKVIILTAS